MKKKTATKLHHHSETYDIQDVGSALEKDC
jgi:hypothetical protein